MFQYVIRRRIETRISPNTTSLNRDAWWEFHDQLNNLPRNVHSVANPSLEAGSCRTTNRKTDINIRTPFSHFQRRRMCKSNVLGHVVERRISRVPLFWLTRCSERLRDMWAYGWFTHSLMELSPSWEAANWQLLKNFPAFYGTRRFHKMLGSSWAAAQLAAFQEGLSSMSEWSGFDLLLSFPNFESCHIFKKCVRYLYVYLQISKFEPSRHNCRKLSEAQSCVRPSHQDAGSLHCIQVNKHLEVDVPCWCYRKSGLCQLVNLFNDIVFKHHISEYWPFLLGHSVW
jgi:hypothetical protein